MAKAGRNDSCPCGSGKKYKKCCALTSSRRTSYTLVIAIGGAVLAAIIIAFTQFTSEREAVPGRVWSAEHGHYH
jgi:hypothetical protein